MRRATASTCRRLSVDDLCHAEAFPAALRHLLVHDEHHATSVDRRTTWRCDKRAGERTPLDCPATIQKNQFLVFRDVAQHLEVFVSGQALVALEDHLLTDFCRRDWAETHGVIGIISRQRNRISRERSGDILLAELLDGGKVCTASPRVACICRDQSLNHFRCQRRCERRAPHPAKAFPAAVRHLLKDHQPSAANLLHLTTRRLNIRTSDVAPLDGPAVEYRQVLGFWNVAQHLDTWTSGPAFVALSNSFFANLRRPALGESHSVIGPQIRQGNCISRQSSGYLLLVELLDAGQVCLTQGVGSRRRTRSLDHMTRQDSQRAEDDDSQTQFHTPSNHSHAASAR